MYIVEKVFLAALQSERYRFIKKGSSRSKEERLKMFPQKSDGIARQSRQRWNSFRICMTKR